MQECPTTFRLAKLNDSPLLAQMNYQLIRAEGHRNPMSIEELTARMSNWLAHDYSAALITMEDIAIGYCLWRQEDEFIYIRQFFIDLEYQGHGFGKSAFKQLRQQFWSDHKLRLEVLIHNNQGRAFWHSVGFSEYCITMEFN